ncbi:MAG: hypothetical protein E7290_08680 [Lachnospiraceae bacterium]|nr:hypothetical protein [Lachnospiraceae bacterium]
MKKFCLKTGLIVAMGVFMITGCGKQEDTTEDAAVLETQMVPMQECVEEIATEETETGETKAEAEGKKW